MGSPAPVVYPGWVCHMGGPPLTYPPLLSYSSVSAGLRLFPPTLIDNIHRIDVPRVSLNA